MYSDAPTFTLVFCQSIVVQASSYRLLLLKEGKIAAAGPPNVRGWLALHATTRSIAVRAFYYVVQHLPLHDAITLQFSPPCWLFSAAIIAVSRLGDRWRLQDMVGTILCLSSVFMIACMTWLFGASLSVASVVTTTIISTTESGGVGLVGALFAAIGPQSNDHTRIEYTYETLDQKQVFGILDREK